MEFEELIESLPIRIQKRMKYRCTCGAEHENTFTYELQCRLDRSYGINGHIRPQYYLYYRCNNYQCPDKYKYIGTHAGMGFFTIKEAYDDLRIYIKEQQ